MRNRVDGARFQAEFERFMCKSYYVKRLPTLNTGYSGLTQPADYIVLGDQFNYVELKETGQDTFSLTSVQQLPEIIDFTVARNSCSLRKAVQEAKYYLVVHFISVGVYRVIEAADIMHLISSRKTLKPTGTEGYVFNSLDELAAGGIL